MNLAEVQNKFPTGSVVKVQDNGHEYTAYDWWAARHLCYEDFVNWKDGDGRLENGDVGIVFCVGHHSEEEEENFVVAIRVEGKKIFLIDAEGVIPFVPAPEEHKEYEVTFDGANLIVAAHGETISHNVEELIERLREECHEKGNVPKVGDLVEVVSGDYFYACYTKWLEMNASFEQAVKFAWRSYPSRGLVGTVIKIAPHTITYEPLYLISVVEDSDERIYLTCAAGIKKI